MGHRVTALYEISLVDAGFRYLDPLRYAPGQAADTARTDEVALLRLRYKQPDAGNSKLIEHPVLKADIENKLSDTSDRFRFSAAVAGFGQLLRGGKFTADYRYDDVLELARGARGSDAFGYRGEFLSLVNLADSLAAARIEG